MVIIYQILPRNSGFFIFTSQIHMNFRTRPTWSLLAHFPEIIFLVSVYYSAFVDMFFPKIVCILVSFQIFGSISFENRHIQIFFRNFINFGQKLPRPSNRFFFEIIPKRPVPQHLEHRMVIGITPYIVQIIMLS